MVVTVFYLKNSKPLTAFVQYNIYFCPTTDLQFVNSTYIGSIYPKASGGGRWKSIVLVTLSRREYSVIHAQ